MSHVLKDVEHVLSNILLEDIHEEWDDPYTLEGCLVDPGPPTPGTLNFLGNFDFWGDDESTKVITPNFDDDNEELANLMGDFNMFDTPNYDIYNNDSVWTPDVLETTLRFYNLLDDDNKTSEDNEGSADYLDDIRDRGASISHLGEFCGINTEYGEQYDYVGDEQFEEEMYRGGKRPRAMRAMLLETKDWNGQEHTTSLTSSMNDNLHSSLDYPKIWAQRGQRGTRKKRNYTKPQGKANLMIKASHEEISGNAKDLLDAILGRGIYSSTSNQPPPNVLGGISSLGLQTPDSSKSPSPKPLSGTAQDRIDAILGRGKYKPTSNQPPPNLPGGIPSLVLQTPDSSRSPRLERLSEVAVPRRERGLRRARSNSHGQQVDDSRQTKRIKTPDPASSPNSRPQSPVEPRNTKPTATIMPTEITTYVNAVTKFANTYIPSHENGNSNIAHEAQDSNEYILDESNWTMYTPGFAPDAVVVVNGAMKARALVDGEMNISDAESGSGALRDTSNWGKEGENVREKRHNMYTQRSLSLRHMDFNSSLPEWSVLLVPVNARSIKTGGDNGESSAASVNQVASPSKSRNQLSAYQIQDVTVNLFPHIDVQPLSPSSSSEPFDRVLVDILPTSQDLEENSQASDPASQNGSAHERKKRRFILKGKGIQKSEGPTLGMATTSNVRSHASRPGDACDCFASRDERPTKVYSIPPSPWQAAGFPPFTHKPVETYFGSQTYGTQGRALSSAAILIQAMSYVDRPLPTNWAHVAYPRVIGFSMKIFCEDQKLQAWSLINKPKVEGKFTCRYTLPKWTPTTYADNENRTYKEYFPVIIERSTKKVMGFNYEDSVDETSSRDCPMKGWTELFSMDWIQPNIFGRVIAANNGLIVLDSGRQQNVMIQANDYEVRRDRREECSDQETNRTILSVVNPLTHELYFLPSIPSQFYRDKVGYLSVSSPFERLYQLFVLGWVTQNKTETLALATYNSANAKWVHFDAIKDAKRGIGGRSGCVMINYGLYYSGVSVQSNQDENHLTVELPSIFYFNCSAQRKQHLVYTFFVQAVSDLLRITDPPKLVLAFDNKVYAAARGVYADSTKIEFGRIVVVDVVLNEDGTPNGQYARVDNGVMPHELMNKLFKFDKYPLQKPQPYEVVGNGNLIAFRVSDPDIVFYNVQKAEWSITCFHDYEPSGVSNNFVMIEGSYKPDWLAAT